MAILRVFSFGFLLLAGLGLASAARTLLDYDPRTRHNGYDRPSPRVGYDPDHHDESYDNVYGGSAGRGYGVGGSALGGSGYASGGGEGSGSGYGGRGDHGIGYGSSGGDGSGNGYGGGAELGVGYGSSGGGGYGNGGRDGGGYGGGEGVGGYGSSGIGSNNGGYSGGVAQGGGYVRYPIYELNLPNPSA